MVGVPRFSRGWSPRRRSCHNENEWSPQARWSSTAGRRRSGCGCAAAPASLVDREWTALGRGAARVGSRSDSASLETLRAGLELVWPDPDTGESKVLLGIPLALVARPRRLRVRGTTKAFFTVFDLVASTDRVWLDVPREDFVVFGDRSDPAWDELPLSPGRSPDRAPRRPVRGLPVRGGRSGAGRGGRRDPHDPRWRAGRSPSSGENGSARSLRSDGRVRNCRSPGPTGVSATTAPGRP